MAKRTTAYPMTLPPRDPAVPGYRWLYAALRDEILAGRLRPGARLPATRDLAAHHGLARGTIVSAFELLTAEGYVRGTVGCGTFVSDVLPDELLHVERRDARARTTEVQPIRLSAFGRRVRLFENFADKPTRAFRANLPALDLFPLDVWTTLATRRLRHVTADLLMGCDALGYRPLREAIAHYVGTSRGVVCTPEQIAIVSGVQEALALTARIVLDAGDRVCVEDPGYPGARHVFAAAGARIVDVAVDDEGMRVQARRMRGARLVYVTPGHQAPLGMTMSLPRRLALLDWARDARALIFEDDYDSEYRYAGRPVPALQGLDRSGTVIFAGSFSKVLFPSLRIGYVVVPSPLVDAFAATIATSTRHAPLLDQAVLCDFISAGHFGRHLRRMREIYAERHAALVDAARARLAGRLTLSPIEAGLQTAGRLAPGIDAEAAAAAAALRDVDVVPLTRDTLQLGFAAVDPREIRRGVRDLAAALESVSTTAPR